MAVTVAIKIDLQLLTTEKLNTAKKTPVSGPGEHNAGRAIGRVQCSVAVLITGRRWRSSSDLQGSLCQARLSEVEVVQLCEPREECNSQPGCP
ncbi:hypothetical protein GN956_G3635 [Arapaima gigas]